MSKIFVSYRRDETSGYAGRLIDRLNERFGAQRVFFDLQTLEPGVDWVESLERALDECQVLIAVIGRNWLDAVDRKGRRRLDNPNDSLRREVARTLERNIRVVPVLVQDAEMPEPRDLPDDLVPLTRRQAIELTNSGWHDDVTRLIKALERIVGEDGTHTPPPDPPPEPPEPANLATILPGTWQVQIMHPMVGVGTLNIQFDPAGWFRGQKMVPGMGMSAVQGQWQVLPGNQVALQGQETLGFQVGPYSVLVQFQEIGSARLVGVTSGGEQVVCQRAG
ncbi:MAG: toll/interleukin-1 receptor domain-containing protein [Deferrisomatales bacterium]|nr:toll/interleukin-1 receptor domain-containing protein [Deferrisomatales bacterium]